VSAPIFAPKPDAGGIYVWDLAVRVFHWGLVLSFAGAYVLGDSERSRGLHVNLGYVVLGLVCFRLLWGFIGTRYARFASFSYGPAEVIRYLKGLVSGERRHYTGHNPAGSWAIYGLLALALATGASGWLCYEEVGGDAWAEAHEVLANLWLALVGVHIAAVIGSSFLHRENLVRAMVTGSKQREPRVAGREGG
jgi:cytochrome b